MTDRCCTRCRGTGREALPPVYAATLVVVRLGFRGRDDGVSARDVARYFAILPTTAINRLEKLRAWGLVTRRPANQGGGLGERGYVYSVADGVSR